MMDLKSLPIRLDDDCFHLTNNDYLEKQLQAIQTTRSPEADSGTVSLESSHSSVTLSDYFSNSTLKNSNNNIPDEKSAAFLKKLEELDESLKLFLDKTSKFANEVNLLEYKSHQLSGKDMTDMDIEIGDDAVPINCLGYGLFSFICTHLENPDSNRIIGWVNKAKRMFAIHDPTIFAKLWGEEKKKEGMNSKKLYRSLNYLVENKGQMKKTNKKFVYIIANRRERQNHNEKRKLHKQKKPQNETQISVNQFVSSSPENELHYNSDISFDLNSPPQNVPTETNSSWIDLSTDLKATQFVTDVDSLKMTPAVYTSAADFTANTINFSSNQFSTLCDDLENIEPTLGYIEPSLGNLLNQPVPAILPDENDMSTIFRKYFEFS